MNSKRMVCLIIFSLFTTLSIGNLSNDSSPILVENKSELWLYSFSNGEVFIIDQANHRTVYCSEINAGKFMLSLVDLKKGEYIVLLKNNVGEVLDTLRMKK